MDGRWLRFTARDGLPEDHVAYVTTLANGETLFVPYDTGGLVRGRLDGDRFSITGRDDADGKLWSDKVYVVGQDARGRTWVGTGSGVEVPFHPNARLREGDCSNRRLQSRHGVAVRPSRGAEPA